MIEGAKIYEGTSPTKLIPVLLIGAIKPTAYLGVRLRIPLYIVETEMVARLPLCSLSILIGYPQLTLNNYHFYGEMAELVEGNDWKS